MRVRNRSRRFWVEITAAGLATLAVHTFVSPAWADDEDYKGWFASLDVALTQPNGLDQHYANHVVSLPSVPPAAPVTSSTVERLVIDNGSDTTWRASVGYNFGRTIGGRMGSLKASYWSFDHDDQQTHNGLLGGVYPTVVGYGFASSSYIQTGQQVTYPIDVTATSSIKAKTYDIDYVRPMTAGEKLTVNWLAGVRVATYEESQGFVGVDQSGPYTYIQTKHFKSDAKGPRFGVEAVFGFTKHFSLQGSMAVSFLQANTKGDAMAIDGVGRTDGFTTSDDHIRGEIRDYDLKAIWGGYGHLDFYLAYAASEWDGPVVDPAPAGGCCAGTEQSRGRDSIAFNSLHAGIVWRISPQKRPFRP